MSTIPEPRKRLRAGEIYLGDNGRAMCCEMHCAGASALYGARDLSGQRVHRIKAPEAAYLEFMTGKPFACECGKTVYPSQTPAVIAARIFTRLDPAWVLYAASADRGDYRGFAALHDLCDANMLVCHEFPMPEDGTEAQMANYFAACSPIMQEVTRLIVDSPLAHIPTDLTNHRPCQPLPDRSAGRQRQP